MAEPKIKKLIAVIGRKQYELVPSASCKGCCFENKCYSLRTGMAKFHTCPSWNDYCIASDLDAIYKEIKPKKETKK